MSRTEVYVCGDTHIEYDVRKLNAKEWPEQKGLTKDDLLIVLGDFGLLWAANWIPSEIWWAKWLTAKPFTTCFIDGNHENFTRLLALPEVDFHGGKAGVAYEDNNGAIYHLKRGQIYTFEGEKVFTLGGASSTDKGYRTPYISWWPEEDVSYAETIDAEDNLTCVGNEVNFILTHTCPTDVCKILNMGRGTLPCATRQFLDWIQENIKFEQWHFGHMHEDRDFLGEYFCHYNDAPYKLI